MKAIKNYIIRFLKWVGFNFVTIRGFVRLQVVNPDGTIASNTDFEENGIPNVALAVFSGLAGNTGAQTALTYLAVGTSSTAFSASQTALQAEIVDSGLARTIATITRSTTTQTNDTLQLDYTWTASGSKTINEIGVFNAASVGVMGARKVTTATAIVSGQLLIATYKITFA